MVAFDWGINFSFRLFMRETLGIFKRFQARFSLAVLSVALAGCSFVGFGPELDDAATASVVKYETPAPLQETVDPSDWDTIRAAMASTLISQPAGAPVPWENAITGSVGTIVPMDVSSNADGRLCRTFSTTLNGIGGVSQYRGDACQRQDGAVELIGLAPHNAVVQVATPTTIQKLN